MIDQTLETCTHSLSLSPTPPRAGGRTRSGSAKTGEEMTSVSLGWCSVWVLQVQIIASCGQRQGFWFQGKNNRCPQICSFTACGGGVSGVSLVGSVGVCEAASQCGDGKGSVLPMGGLASACWLAFLLVKKARKSVCVRCVCVCVCVRDVVKPTGKAGQCRTAAAVRW
jgi:hypothetical protein